MPKVNVHDLLCSAGIPSDSVLLLEAKAPSHKHISYLDIFSRVGSASVEVWPDAVVEMDGRAVMYVVRHDRLGCSASDHAEGLQDLLWTLACRADARHLAVIELGSVTVYPIGLSISLPQPILDRAPIHEETAVLRDFLTNRITTLASLHPGAKQAEARWLDEFMFDLMIGAADQLHACSGLEDAEVLSLVGRALFTRFLADRGIIEDRDAAAIASGATDVESLFANARNMAATFRWLDSTFNGDLLPLKGKNYTDFFRHLGQEEGRKVCSILSAVLLRAVGGQMELNWRAIRFRHVPVDLLSQVYERFSHNYTASAAKKTSVHYTPRNIAQHLLDSAFDALGRHQKDTVRVLDPAVGGGVFLVLAMRRLVQERWRRTKLRPTRKDIRNILNRQLCGFDINQESIKFAALSLYLTALELDPRPTPLSDLRFDELYGTVLHNVGEDALEHSADSALGSLSASLKKALPPKFAFGFDIVISNPPWTSLGKSNGKYLSSLVREVARERGSSAEEIADYANPDYVPDIPFIWRATQWARPGGALAFAVHGRLLFRQADNGRTRNLLFQSVRVTGVLNASALRQEKNIWPGISAPFCLLVARNDRPSSRDGFYYVSPVRERNLNANGQFRIDPDAAQPVSNDWVRSQPGLFKTLFRGNSLDIDIVARIAAPGRTRLVDYWEENGLEHGEGYQVASQKLDASHMIGLPDLATTSGVPKILDTEKLPRFTRLALHSPRNPEVYRGPMVLFRESPKSNRNERGGILSLKDVCFIESFSGYSCAKFNAAGAENLAKYVFTLSYSNVFLYFALMTSSKFGVERDSLLKEDVDNFPIIPLEALSQDQISSLHKVCESLGKPNIDWIALDKFVGDLYQLSGADLQAISDTLASQLPYRSNKDWADSAPNTATVNEYVTFVGEMLNPFSIRSGNAVSVQRLAQLDTQGWRYFRVTVGVNTPVNLANLSTTLSTRLADRFWAARVVFKVSAGEVIFGLLAQNRYWTKTCARLLALEILRNELHQQPQIERVQDTRNSSRPRRA